MDALEEKERKQAWSIVAPELRELVEEWRETASMKHPDELDVFNARCGAWEKAADELEEVLESDD